MTAADITELIEVNDPTKEVVIVTASDAETYTSKKFATLRGVQATLMEDTGAGSIPLSCSISGGVATIHSTDGASDVLTDKKVCLVLYGRK
jgi:hypothetical protein